MYVASSIEWCSGDEDTSYSLSLPAHVMESDDNYGVDSTDHEYVATSSSAIDVRKLVYRCNYS